MRCVRDKLHVFGGTQGGIDNIITGECYDVTTNQWTELTPCDSTGGQSFAPAVVNGDKIFILGGMRLMLLLLLHTSIPHRHNL